MKEPFSTYKPGVDGVKDGSKRRTRLQNHLEVRLPTDTDWQQVRALVRQHHATTSFAHMEFSSRKLEHLIEQAQNPKIHECLLVAGYKSSVVGLAWFSAGEYILTEHDVMTTVHLLAIDKMRCGPYMAAKAFTRLMRGICIWSKTRSASVVLLHVTTGHAIGKTDRLVRAGGGTLLGGAYAIKL